VFWLYRHVRFTPHTVELRLLLKPFIPDMIPSVGDVDPMIKVTFSLKPGFHPTQRTQRSIIDTVSAIASVASLAFVV